LLGDWRSSMDLAVRYDAITAEQVRAVGERYLRPEKRSVTTLLPTGGGP